MLSASQSAVHRQFRPARSKFSRNYRIAAPSFRRYSIERDIGKKLAMRLPCNKRTGTASPRSGLVQPIAPGNAGWPVQFRFAVHAGWSRVPELWTLDITRIHNMTAPQKTQRVRRTWRTPMAVLGCAALAIAVYGTLVYAYTRPEIPKVSVALIVSSCLVGAISGLLGLRLGTVLEQVRR